jgi:DNA-binding LacI/PurR family transcriptional regulator
MARPADGFTAIFCFNDEASSRWLGRWASVCPRSCRVVGFDDIRFAQHTVPLTTIAQPTRQIGEGTVRLLLKILSDGGDSAAPESDTLPHKFVVRASTAPARQTRRPHSSAR